MFHLTLLSIFIKFIFNWSKNVSIIMIYVLICLLSFTFLINVKADSIQRSLLTWASYSSCSSWYTDSTWLYISGSWYNSSTSTLRTDYYNDNTESVYWSSYSSSGYINLDNYGSNQISLYQLSSASISLHSVWQWRFYNTASNQIKIQINRSTENFEDIYMYVNYSNGDVATYSNRDLSNWNDLVYNYTLTNTTYASIKVRRWSINSS